MHIKEKISKYLRKVLILPYLRYRKNVVTCQKDDPLPAPFFTCNDSVPVIGERTLQIHFYIPSKLGLHEKKIRGESGSLTYQNANLV
ncbi:MAG: hypothetical protein ACPKOP_00170, partial [Sphaerochaetaceae bacterium]